jgi:molybdopterin converting factor small subunit
MKIKVNFLGMLPNYTGVESIDVELGDDARYDDLLAEIAIQFGDKLPEKCWSSKRNEFRKPISAIGSNGDIDERDAPLAGHEEINFLIPVSGGARDRKGYSKWRQFL